MKLVGLMLSGGAFCSHDIVDAMQLSKQPKATLAVPADTPRYIKPGNHGCVQGMR